MGRPRCQSHVPINGCLLQNQELSSEFVLSSELQPLLIFVNQLVVFFLKACWTWVTLIGDENMSIIVQAIKSLPTQRTKAKVATTIANSEALQNLVKSCSKQLRQSLGGMDFWNADGMDTALAQKEEMSSCAPLDKDIVS